MVCFRCFRICRSLCRLDGSKIHRFKLPILRVEAVSLDQTSLHSRNTEPDAGNKPARDQKPKVAAEAAMTL